MAYSRANELCKRCRILEGDKENLYEKNTKLFYNKYSFSQYKLTHNGGGS
jgi:hypothetical protein